MEDGLFFNEIEMIFFYSLFKDFIYGFVFLLLVIVGLVGEEVEIFRVIIWYFLLFIYLILIIIS